MDSENKASSLSIRKKGKPWVLRGLTIVYLLLYILVIFEDVTTINFSSLEDLTILLLFLYFATAFGLSWFRERTAGYMLILYYLLEMVLILYVWTDASMIIILGFPALPIGIFYILYAFRRDSATLPEKHLQWRLVLRLSVSALVALYLIGIPDGLAKHTGELLHTPYIYMPLLMLLLLSAFVVSWKNELIAGLLLVIWYVGILVLVGFFPGLPNEIGPMRFLGLPVLGLRLLLIIYWIQLKPKETG
jgi:hypothetical protein